MTTITGAGNFNQWLYPERITSLSIGGGIFLPIVLVEIAGEENAGVIWTYAVCAYSDSAHKVPFDNILVESLEFRGTVSLINLSWLQIAIAIPYLFTNRRIALFPSLQVLPQLRVKVFTCYESFCKKRDFVFRGVRDLLIYKYQIRFERMRI